MKKIFGAGLVLALLIGCFTPAHAEQRTWKAGVADRTVYFIVFDSSSTAGARLATLAFNTANLDCEYTRSGAAQTAGGISLVTQTATGAHTDGGFVHVGKGAYRLDLPDAATAAGVNYVRVDCDGAANMVPVAIEIELVAYDPQAGTNLGLSALPTANAGANTGLPVVGSQIPNANAAAAGGLPTVGTGSGQVNPTGGRIPANVEQISGDTTAADNAELYFDGTGYSDLDNKVGVIAGGITSDSFATTGTISAESGTTLSLSGGVGANDQFNVGHRIVVYAASGGAMLASSCITDTINGSPDQVVTREDISGLIAVSDTFDLRPDGGCDAVRPTVAGRTVDLTAGGEVGLDLDNTVGTLVTAEIPNLDAAITTRLAPTVAGRTVDLTTGGEVGLDLNNTTGTWDAAEFASDFLNASKVAADVTTELQSGLLTTSAFNTKIPTNLSFTGANVNANAQVVADKTGYSLTAGEHTAISGDVWGALRSSYTGSGTFGQSAQIIRSGTAQAGASTTITLDASASAVNDFYINSTITIIGGTGAGQTRQITAYVGSSKVGTVNAAWATNPASDSVFLITGNGINPAVSGLTAADVWSYGGGRSITDKAGFSLTQAFPTNFASLAITGGGAVTVGTNNDKTGYSLSQSFPTNFSNLSIDANGRVDLSRWLGGTPNALISGRVDVNAQVVADKTGYSLTQTFPSNFSALSIDASGRTDVSKVRGVTLAAQVGTNFDTFFQNAGNVTTKVVDDVSGGAGGTADWTATEKNQIRYRLGVDGTTNTPSATANLGNVTVGGYAASQDPATLLLVTPANKIGTNASNQVVASSVAGNVGGNVVGSVASVTNNVTVGGYAAGQDPATLVLVTPANKIATNGTNQVVASSVQGNVTGTVASVTGSVGSVTGSVGGNVTGSVGSVAGSVGGNVAGSVASVTNPVTANVTQLEGISLSGKVGDNFNVFFQNSGVDTSKEVEDVGTGAGGGGGSGIEMDQLVPGSPDSGSVGQALRFVLDRLDLNVSTRASQASIDSKIPTNISFTGPNVNARVKGLDDDVMTPAVMGLPEATVVTAAAGCNNGVNSGSMFSTNLTQAQANFFRSVHLVTMTSGALEHSSAQITGYTFTGSVGCLTVSPAFPAAPSIGDTLTIVNR
jgi:hypothetical protein